VVLVWNEPPSLGHREPDPALPIDQMEHPLLGQCGLAGGVTFQ
jgi:hypothetical protein